MSHILKDYEYIVGIDIGSQSTTIGYLNQSDLRPVTLDTSGGYKNLSIPTVMQFILGDGMWLIGHNAKENSDMENTVYVDGLMAYVETKKELIIEGKTFKSHDLMGIYLKALLKHFSNINPNALIKSVVLSIGHKASEYLIVHKDELQASIMVQDFEIITDQKAIARYLHYHKYLGEETCHILDYGYSGLKYYTGKINSEDDSETVYIKHVKDYRTLACEKIESLIRELLTDKYKEQMKVDRITETELLSINQILFQYYVWFFQKMREKKALNVFYNFAYPPFKASISYEQMKQMMGDTISKYVEIWANIKTKDNYFLMGNGYRMAWTKEVMEESNIDIHQEVILKGAILESGRKVLGLQEINLMSEQRSAYAYGIMMDKRLEDFLPIIEKGSKYDQVYNPVALIVDYEDNHEALLDIVKYDDQLEHDRYKTVETINLGHSGEDRISRVSVQLGLDIKGRLETKYAVLPL